MRPDGAEIAATGVEALAAGMAVRAADIGFSRFRGGRVEPADGILLVNDCHNANLVAPRRSTRGRA